jgi:uncharacterized protein
MEREPLPALIDVTQLLKEPVGSSRSYDLNGVIHEEVKGLVEGKAKLIHISQGVLVQCELTTEVELICSRCLDTFLLPVSYTAEEEFASVSDLCRDLVLPSSEQSERFTIDDRNILDLSELIRQYTLLNLPMKPLCRLDCPGVD